MSEEATDPGYLVSEEPAEPAHRYEFDSDFQKKIVALLVRDASFVQMTDGLIKPEFFEEVGMRAVVVVANRYIAKYKKSPGDKSILVSLFKDSLRDKVLPSDMVRHGAKAIQELFELDVSDRDYVADECAMFARHQAVGNAILESVALVEKRDFETIGKSLRKALDVGVAVSAGSCDYGASLEARTQRRKDRLAGKLPPSGISTGYPALDQYLYHKGWGRREMAVLMGGPKAGKSMAMIGFGVNAVAAGYRTLYVTLEVSSDIISDRIDANIAERAMMELDLHAHEVEEKVRAFMAKAAPYKIEEYPTGAMRVADLRRIIERHKANGMIFDLVIVDYADLMCPESRTDNVQENSKSIYQDLRGLAMTEGFAMLTATQTNREGAKKAVATMTDVAEDLNKIRIADVVISINKSEEERSLNQARLHFAASRNQRSGFTLKVEQNIDQAKFITKVIGED